MKELIEEVKRIEDEERFSHSLSVAEECMSIADIFSLTIPARRRLYKAGILHDITKGYTKEEHIKAANEYGIVLSNDDLLSPAVLHEITGAEKAKRDFAKYVDDTVYFAIRRHTTGDAEMSLSDKILFVADYIEKTRKHEVCIEAREYFYYLAEHERPTKALDLTAIRCLENTIDHLKGKPIHPLTISAYEALTKVYQRKE